MGSVNNPHFVRACEEPTDRPAEDPKS
jgi:hypothetical protein